jgi:hypothetical protein
VDRGEPLLVQRPPDLDDPIATWFAVRTAGIRPSLSRYATEDDEVVGMLVLAMQAANRVRGSSTIQRTCDSTARTIRTLARARPATTAESTASDSRAMPA